MRPVDEEEVITTVTGCTKKKSSDFEDISMDTVAKVLSVICKPLAHICNIWYGMVWCLFIQHHCTLFT